MKVGIYSLCIVYSKGYTYWVSLPLCKKDERDNRKRFRRENKAVRLYTLILGEK